MTVLALPASAIGAGALGAGGAAFSERRPFLSCVEPLEGVGSLGGHCLGRADVARRITEALDHDRGEVLALVCDRGASADGIAVGAHGCLGFLAALEVARAVHHQLAEAQ